MKLSSRLIGALIVLVVVAWGGISNMHIAYARGGGKVKVTTPSGGYHTGGFKAPTTHGNTGGSSHTVINNHTTVYHSTPSFSPFSWFLFYPHHSVYYDSYGIAHSSYIGFSFVKLLIDIITLFLVIAILLYVVRKISRR